MFWRFSPSSNRKEILRNAPKPTPPADLILRLRADLRRHTNNQANPHTPSTIPWFRRWLPLFGTAMVLLCCAAVAVAQTRSVSALKKANLSLRAKVATLGSAQSNSTEIQRVAAENQEFDRLRKDHEEALQLREEITRLQVLLPIIARLHIENQDLADQLARRSGSGTSTPGGRAISRRRRLHG
jgi:hypothetical protein